MDKDALRRIFPRGSASFLEANAGVTDTPVQSQRAIVTQTTRVIKRAMNNTEREFSFMLEAKKREGEIEGWTYEAVKLRLANRTWYTPDFMVIVNHNEVAETLGYRAQHAIKFIEVKGGFVREDAMIKFKVAREQITWAEFELWQKADGRWTRVM